LKANVRRIGNQFTKHLCSLSLQELVDVNHSLLAALGVSHPALEKVREISSKLGLKSKLTGAGGGGCALTLIRDGKVAIDDHKAHL
jgi:mevalonate kinase